MSLWTNKDWKPMLLSEIKSPFQDENYLFEMKFDGIRAILYVSRKKVIIKSRNGNDISHLYPELQNIKELVNENTIFDGEIIALKKGRPSFEKLQERIHLQNKIKIQQLSEKEPVIFMCFDILYQGKDLINIPLMKRKEILCQIKDNDYFLKVRFIEADGIQLFKSIKKLNLEGMVAKRKDSIYEPNQRTDNWIKIKNLKSKKCWIGGYIEKEKNAVISLLLGEKQHKKLVFIGKVTMSKRNPLYEKIKKEEQIKNPFENCQEKATFIKPKYQCNIEYLEKTKSGQLRHPIFKNR